MGLGPALPIVVASGIEALPPFTIGTYPVIESDNPAAIGVGNIQQSTDAVPKVYVGTVTRAANIDPLATILGGATISQNAAGAQHHIVIGENSVIGIGTPGAAGTEVIVIGPDCVITPTTQALDLVVIGAGISLTAGGWSQGVIIGGQTTFTASATNPTVIGFGSTVSVADNALTLVGAALTRNTNSGPGATALGQGSVLRAQGTVAVGSGLSVSGGFSIGIGSGAQCNDTDATFAQQIAIGYLANVGTGRTTIGLGARVSNPSNFANCVIIGHSMSPSQANQIAIGGAANGGVGGPATSCLLGGLDTVAGYAGMNVRFPNGTGTNNTVGDLSITAPRATGNANGGKIILQTGTRGASGAVLQAVAAQVEILQLDTAIGSPAINFPNVVNGAGAAAGTLTNAPTAGDPVFWLPIQIAGVTRYIPCWA